MTQYYDIERFLLARNNQERQTEIAALRKCHPSDIAEALEKGKVSPEQVVEILSQVGNHKAAEAFAQLSIELQQACLEAGNLQIMLHFVENMEPDDRAHLLKVVDDDLRESIMPLIAQAERNDIRKLLGYMEGTAGAMMTTDYAMLPKDLSVSAAMAHLRLHAYNKETLYNIQITDRGRNLIGTISLRDLIMARPETILESIVDPNIISVPHNMDIEEVAAVFSKYDLVSVPVVDEGNRLVGMITVDDVLDIMEAESTEDFQRISAVMPFDEKYFKRPLPRLFWSRFIWLAVLLFTSLVSTTIMEANEAALHEMLALAFFIPMIIGTCGNAGTQSATMIVRAMAVGEVELRDIGRVFHRELLMGLALGISLGAIAYFRVFLQDHHLLIGIIVASALVVTLLTANLVGALLPLFLRRIGLDPALTAGPFIATIIDAIGIAIYFQIAFLLMRQFA